MQNFDCFLLGVQWNVCFFNKHLRITTIEKENFINKNNSQKK
jgi:hypothetical protein